MSRLNNFLNEFSDINVEEDKKLENKEKVEIKVNKLKLSINKSKDTKKNFSSENLTLGSKTCLKQSQKQNQKQIIKDAVSLVDVKNTLREGTIENRENLFINKEEDKKIDVPKIVEKKLLKLNKKESIELKIINNTDIENDKIQETIVESNIEKDFIDDKKQFKINIKTNNIEKDLEIKEKLNFGADQIDVPDTDNNTNNKQLIDNNVKLIENDNGSIDSGIEKINSLFVKSETLYKFKDNWFALYEKAINSDKKTTTNQKIKDGRFRFNIDGNLEILAEFDTSGRTSKDLLNLSWKI